jgi:hypothetical protein
MPDRLTLLTWLARLSRRVTCTLSRALVAEVARRGLVVTGWAIDGRLLTAPARRDVDLPEAKWPECNAFTTVVAMGGQRRAEA